MDRLTELKARFDQEPLAKHLDISLTELENGRAVLVAPVFHEILIVGGIVQGGITTVVADYAGVYAAMTRIITGHTPAENISISFFRPIREGDIITAEAKILNESRSTIAVNVNVTGRNGKLMAACSILFAKPRT